MASTAQADAPTETSAGSSARTRALWELRLTSLWTPVTVLVAVFAPYVTLVQLWPSTVTWALPLMRGVALLMVIAFFALLIARFAVPRLRTTRSLKVEAVESLTRLDRQRARIDALPASAREAVRERAVALEQQLTNGAAPALADALKKLTDVADKQLPGWRARTTMEGWGGLVLTLIGVLLLRTVVVEPFKIPSGSMLPTLQIGDHVVVNRFIYGVRIPFMNVVPFVIVRKPQRGDVIVFENPLDSSKDFIKRVIGIPGDRVEIDDEQLIINGQPQPRVVLGDDVSYDKPLDEWMPETATKVEEDLSGVKHAVYLSSPNRGHQGPFVVPEGHVFVMGDNRNNSADSRLGFGVAGHSHEVAYVPYGNIKGKAMVIWLALGYGGVGSNLFGGTGLRTERLFEPVR